MHVNGNYRCPIVCLSFQRVISDCTDVLDQRVWYVFEFVFTVFLCF